MEYDAFVQTLKEEDKVALDEVLKWLNILSKSQKVVARGHGSIDLHFFGYREGLLDLLWRNTGSLTRAIHTRTEEKPRYTRTPTEGLSYYVRKLLPRDPSLTIQIPGSSTISLIIHKEDFGSYRRRLQLYATLN